MPTRRGVVRYARRPGDAQGIAIQPSFPVPSERLVTLLALIHPDSVAYDLAKELTALFGSEAAIFSAPAHDLMMIPGIGERTARLLCFQHEWRQGRGAGPAKLPPLIASAEAAYRHLLPLFTQARIEIIRVLFLDAKCRLLSDAEMGRGTVRRVAVYPGEIARHALLTRAAGLILAHNHPAGNVQPSDDDRAVTTQLRRALEALEIVFHDHLIIGGEDWYSFRAAGLLA